VWDSESIAAAQREKDLCRLRIASVKKCAPGWNAGLAQDTFCSDFKICKAEFKRMTSQWGTFGAENITRPGEIQKFQLPVGWNQLEKFERAAVKFKEPVVRQLLLTESWFWLIVHAPLIGIAGVGWVFLLLGMFVGRDRKPLSEFEGMSSW
jgi:hypothetical protein